MTIIVRKRDTRATILYVSPSLIISYNAFGDGSVALKNGCGRRVSEKKNLTLNNYYNIVPTARDRARGI